MKKLLAMLTFLFVGQADARAALGPMAIEAEARRAMESTGGKGLAIAVIDGGRIHSVQAFGYRNAANQPLTVDTIMYGASLAKTVFATLVLQLVDEGRIDLDAPLARYLPKPLSDYGNLDAYGNWGDLASDERWKTITARHVLTHSTGFANFAFLEPDGKLRIHFQPGARYAYSGEGMMLLQFVIERGLGLNLADELDRRIFKPTGMTRTSLQWREDFKVNLADGWTIDGKPVPHDERSRVRAAGSMDTTIGDMARFAAAYAGGRLLSVAAQRRMTAASLPITTAQQFPTLIAEAKPQDQVPAFAAGLGILTFTGPQGRGWFKGGHDDSTGNTLVCMERGARCVLIMSNDVRAEAAYPHLVRSILGETGVPYRWEYPSLKSW